MLKARLCKWGGYLGSAQWCDHGEKAAREERGKRPLTDRSQRTSKIRGWAAAKLMGTEGRRQGAVTPDGGDRGVEHCRAEGVDCGAETHSRTGRHAGPEEPWPRALWDVSRLPRLEKAAWDSQV